MKSIKICKDYTKLNIFFKMLYLTKTKDNLLSYVEKIS